MWPDVSRAVAWLLLRDLDMKGDRSLLHLVKAPASGTPDIRSLSLRNALFANVHEHA